MSQFFLGIPQNFSSRMLKWWRISLSHLSLIWCRIAFFLLVLYLLFHPRAALLCYAYSVVLLYSQSSLDTHHPSIPTSLLSRSHIHALSVSLPLFVKTQSSQLCRSFRNKPRPYIHIFFISRSDLCAFLTSFRIWYHPCLLSSFYGNRYLFSISFLITSITLYILSALLILHINSDAVARLLPRSCMDGVDVILYILLFMSYWVLWLVA